MMELLQRHKVYKLGGDKLHRPPCGGLKDTSSSRGLALGQSQGGKLNATSCSNKCIWQIFRRNNKDIQQNVIKRSDFGIIHGTYA